MNGAASASCCGPTLSGATSGANLATGATDGSVTTTGSGGTMYGCVHPSATVPTQAQVIAGSSPCVDAQTKGSPSAGAVAFNSAGSNRFTGLSGSTEYAASYVHVDGTHRPVWQLRTSAPFTTLAGGGGGDDAPKEQPKPEEELKKQAENLLKGILGGSKKRDQQP